MTSAVLWLFAAVLAEATGVWLLAATVGWVGSSLYAENEISWVVFALLLGAFAVVRACAGVTGGLFGARVGTAYRRRAQLAAMSASPDAVRAIGPGAAVMKALDVESVGEMLARASAGWILGFFEIVAAFVVITVFALPTSMVLMLAAVILVLSTLVTLLVRTRRDWRASRLEITARTMEGLLGLETTHVLDEPHLAADELARRIDRYGLLSARMDQVAVGMAALPGVTLLALLLPLFASPDVGPARSAMIIAISVLATSGIARLALVSADAVAAKDAADGMRALDDVRLAIGSEPLAAGVPRHVDPCLDGRGDRVLLRASQVMVEYAAGEGLTTPIDFIVQEGDRLLISAPSGFGKTTFGEVLAGERAPTSGEVQRREDIVVARVLQADDDHMFANSLLFNLVGGIEWPAGPDIHRRAQTLLDELGLTPLVESMPAGLAQPIGEGGWRLSSGERTRVSLASALLRRPDVLILDESIATLDGATRDLVLAACARHSKSTLLFAHWD